MTQKTALAILAELEQTAAQVDDRLRDLITRRELSAVDCWRLIRALRRRGRMAQRIDHHKQHLRRKWRGRRPAALK